MPSFIPVDFDPFEDGKEIEKITFTNDSQREIWLSCIIGGEEANLAYNESVSLDFDGQLDYDAFKKAIDKVVSHHEALRSTISPNGEMLIIYKNFPVLLELKDISSLNPNEQKEEIQEFLNQELGTPLDLENGPLFKVFLHKLNLEKYYFTLIKHHAIGDGWSTGIILEDLSKFYNAHRAGNDLILSRSSQISDYVIAQDRFKLTDEYKATEDYWLNLYKDHVPVVDLPTDRPRIHPRTYNGRRIDYPLPAALVNQLKTIGAKAGTSLVTTLLSAFEVFLYLKTHQKDIVVGLPSSGQAASGLYDMVGHCVNLLPLKSNINPKQSFESYLKRRKSEVLDAYEHQRLTFGELIKKLYIPRDNSRITLVPVIFNIDMGMDQAVTFEGLKHRLISNPRKYENFEVYLNATGSKEGIVLEWSYNTDLFNSLTIEKFHSDYESILEKVTKDAGISISDLDERKDDHLNDASNLITFPVDKTLNELIYEAAKNYPEKIALTLNGSTLTYKVLNERANRLAKLLISKNVQVNDRIAISVDRSIEMVIVLLAIIKTGSAYVPIDINYPKERINFVLQNSDAKYLIVAKENAERYEDLADKLLFTDDIIIKAAEFDAEDLSVKTNDQTLVYILHTSGSTGIPKGVCMGQSALVNLLLWQKENSVAVEETKTLQFSPLSFDVSFQEIFATLTRGGNLILITEDFRLDPFKLLSLIKEQQVNRIFLPFVALQSITEIAEVSHIYPVSLKEVMTAGEQLKITPQIVNFFLKIPNSVLYNQYGPTEAHVVTELKLSGNPETWPALPNIGKAIKNTRIFILDEALDEIPQGTIGELCITGLCLAEGYLNLPEMTKEKFAFLHKSGIRIYRTGDLARFLPDGNIEFLGRIDHQVKIRGYRIELGEIEAHLNKLKGIKQAVVNAQEDVNGNKKLIAYLTSDAADFIKKETVTWHDRWESIYDSGISSEKLSQESSDYNLDKHILKQISNSDDYGVQADEWVLESVRRIKEIGATKIMEIGCGGGVFISELASTVDEYYATDYSTVAISYINEKISNNPEWQHVSATVAEANDFSHLPAEIAPDLVLINSVIQYFPDVEYLLSVIDKAANTIQKGCIFIGDVQGSSTLKMHHSAEQLVNSRDDLSIADFEESIVRRINMEDELLVDPEFFYFVQQHISKVTHVDIQLRKGSFVNETTKYHYDVWLYVNSDIQISEPFQIIDWNNLCELDKLKEQLAKYPLKTIIVNSIPNGRIWKDYHMVKIIKQLPGDKKVSDLKLLLNDVKSELAFDPNTFWTLGDELDFQTYVRWANDGSDGKFEAIFIPKNSKLSRTVRPTGILPKSFRIEDFHAVVNVIMNTVNSEVVNTWKDQLKDVLPEYMIPNEFVIINKLPLTTTGKIDRKSLPTISTFTNQPQTSSFIAPRTSMECMVSEIWSEVLNIKDISIDKDFFELGGHSLIAVKVMVAIEKQTGKRLPLAILFENSTIEKLAKMVGTDEGEIKWDSLVTIKKSGNKTPIYMIHGGGLNVLVFNPLGRYMDQEQPIYGMQALGLNGKMELHYSMEELADRYNAEILQNDPVGPYAIAGYSFGGLLAYEMAKRLIAMGKEVKMLGILDTYAGGKDSQEHFAKKIYKKVIRQFKKISFFGALMISNPKETVNYQLLVLKRRINRLLGAKIVTYDRVFLYDEEIYKSYDTAWKNYMMQPFDIHVDLFKTKKRIYFLDDMSYLGWKQYAKRGVSVHEVPGDHKTFLFPPNDKEFSEILQGVLDSKL